MIRIINGATSIGGRLILTGQTVSADPKAEANLVCRGAAEYVGAEGPAPCIPPSEDGQDEPEYVSYEDMTAAELRDLCDARNIPYKKNASAKALRTLLEDGDGIVLKAADPVDV